MDGFIRISQGNKVVHTHPRPPPSSPITSTIPPQHMKPRETVKITDLDNSFDMFRFQVPSLSVFLFKSSFRSALFFYTPFTGRAVRKAVRKTHESSWHTCRFSQTWGRFPFTKNHTRRIQLARAHAHTRARTHTPARVHARTRTHTHTHAPPPPPRTQQQHLKQKNHK